MRSTYLSSAIVISLHLTLLGQSEVPERFQKWLSEEVPYIITSSEKGRFLKLKTNEERERFIKEFWHRRDPDPSTEENEFKREYEERIAYANDKFGFENVAGWRTDRGHVYIRYGKPDEKEAFSYSKPDGNGGVLFGEMWFYRFIPGVGKGIELEFLDASGTGEFRLRRQH